VGRLLVAQLRRGWAAILAIALVTMLLLGGALAAFAGARRSSTALDRFIAFNHPSDVEVIAQSEDADMTQVDALPQVETSTTGSFLLFVPTDDAGNAVPDEVGAIAPILSFPVRGNGEDLERPRVLRGRLADPSAPLETTINEELASKRHLDVGSTLRVVALSPEQARHTDGPNHDPVPEGPALAFTVVGVTRTPADLNPGAETQDVIYEGSPEMRLGKAFWDAYGDKVGTSGSPDVFRSVRLRNGAADLPAFADAVRALPHGDSMLLQSGTSDVSQGSDLARDAIGLETTSLVLLGAVLAVAGALLVGLGLSRVTEASATDFEALCAMGLRPRQLLVVACARAGAGIVVGTLGALLVALLASPLSPIGLGREAEIDPGMHVDATVFALGAVGILVVMGGVLALVGRRTVRALTRPRASAQPSWLAERSAASGAPATFVLGARFATGGAARRAAPVRATVAIVAIGAIALAAVATFTSSLDHVTADPAAYGWTWDVRLGNPNSSDFDAADEAKLHADPNVAAFAAVSDPSQPGTVDGEQVAIGGYQPIDGTVGPELLEGRYPQAQDEVVLGHATLAAIGKHVGDEVTLGVQSANISMRVVGTALLNDALGSGQTAGDGAMVTIDGLRAIAADISPDVHVAVNGYLLRLRDGVSVAAAYDELRATWGRTVLQAQMPIDVAYVRRVRSVPLTLAALVGAAALLLLLYTLVATVRQRRRELATLKALGATRRQLAASVSWQAVILVVIAFAIGLPIGVIGGRLAWRSTAEGLGLVTDPLVPVLALGALVLIAVVVAGLVSAAPAWSAGRTPAARSLRSE
jgi:hypothetical protein